jgi:hypothetical protein
MQHIHTTISTTITTPAMIISMMARRPRAAADDDDALTAVAGVITGSCCVDVVDTNGDDTMRFRDRDDVCRESTDEA